ncbi:DUF4573 domain-containing protein [Nostoc sp. FACHB-892]|uniref:winged helix-turn-helix domain-containing protein n=1 Tax=Nostoc sp. FACHB-892 TaxID=2692843 RepID=UPI001687A215|nr:DUF4573 domain-containing protein [Nostoc sp. FACHB-892]MBD2731940.1 DUF4573 domain-containing protein [Nostoc sp. FACHB-892]
MDLINIEIKGPNQQIEKFLRKLTQRGSGGLVSQVTRIPCVGEIIQLGFPDWETEVFRIIEVMHYTYPSWCNAWGRITVEPCNLLFSVTKDIDELEEIDDIDGLEEVEDIDGLEEVEDIDGLEEVEDIDGLEEVEDIDGLEEVEDIDGLEEVEDIDGLEEVEDIDGLEEVEDIDGLEEVDEDDNSLFSTRCHFGRIPRGICTPEEAYKLPILKALDKLGGSAKTKNVLALVEKLMKGILNQVDYQNYKNKKASYTVIEPRWQKRTKWVRYRLMQKGFVKSDSRRGIWEISEAGRQYLAKHQNNNQ